MIIYFYGCVTYCLSLSLSLNERAPKTFKYFIATLAVNFFTFGDLKIYAVPLMSATLMVLLMIEKESWKNALFRISYALTITIMGTVPYLSFVNVFFLKAVGTWQYEVFIGTTQLITIILLSPVRKKLLAINYSIKIKMTTVVVQLIFVVSYFQILPRFANMGFDIYYSFFGLFSITILGLNFYIAYYIQGIDNQKSIKEKELKTIKDLYKSMTAVWKEALKRNHYTGGLIGTMTKYFDSNDFEGLKTYYSSAVIPVGKINEGNINNIEFIQDELIQNLIYFTHKRAISFGIIMLVEIRDIITSFNMDTLDLFNVLNIYFDNAIEASQKSNIPFINVNIGYFNHSVSIEIVNSTIYKEFQDYYSDRNRGHGLTFAREYTTKYDNVTCDTKIEEGRFTQKLFIGESEMNGRILL